MHPETLKISMAGFFHDIGKFAGKKEMVISSNNIDSYDEQLYLKSSKGRFSHYHALYTARFIEKFSDFLTVIPCCFSIESHIIYRKFTLQKYLNTTSYF